MDNKIKLALNKAYSKMIPEDFYKNIEQNLDCKQGRTMILPMKNQNNKKYLRYALSIAAALVLVFTGAFGGIYYSNNIAVDSIIDLDVNPSVEITTNKNDRVIDAIAVNKDAKTVLQDMDLKGTDLDVAVNAIIGSMLKNGYLSANSNGEILVTVQNNDKQKANIIKTEILSEIKALLKSKEVKADLLNQVTTKDESAQDFALKHKISLGKAIFIEKLVAKDSSLNADELAKMSIAEISKTISSKKIDITDIIDYDYDDGIAENIVDEIEDIQENPVNAEKPKEVISEDRAKHIACGDAKVNVNNAIFKKVKLDTDDGKKYYDIEFSINNNEYDYEIDAYSGAILDKDVDRDNVIVSKPTGAEKPVVSESPTSSANISEKKAKSIVLEHIGANSKDVVFRKVNLEYDDGRRYYDIELVYNNYEYDYEISYKTGKILEHSSERAEGYNNPSATKITKDKARALALSYAKVSAEDVIFESIELDDDDGRSVYEIEFRANGYEYSCSVDAISGKIFDFEKERDD